MLIQHFIPYLIVFLLNTFNIVAEVEDHTGGSFAF
ncbi:hypothetical protein SLEP1_g35885 [Rubroshorea leprosula]|uniref:PsbI n=1 Tax=Rubroshorea leprosula TaxID=152421 RepID=A0AAV5KPR6_9ROSI|nr:hypothetical protein SLEP1_g35885 [Rubroshorea leprosula]